MKKYAPILVIIALLVGIVSYGKYSTSPQTPERVGTTEMEQGTPGAITKNTDGTSIYTNNKYKLSFSFPSTWNIGDNRIDYGTFQLFNYPADLEARWQEGMNKIEVVMIEEFKPTLDPRATVTETTVAGVSAYRSEYREAHAEDDFASFVSYAFIVPSAPNEYLHVTISGSPENYPVLENLIKSFKWL